MFTSFDWGLCADGVFGQKHGNAPSGSCSNKNPISQNTRLELFLKQTSENYSCVFKTFCTTFCVNFNSSRLQMNQEVLNRVVVAQLKFLTQYFAFYYANWCERSEIGGAKPLDFIFFLGMWALWGSFSIFSNPRFA